LRHCRWQWMQRLMQQTLNASLLSRNDSQRKRVACTQDLVWRSSCPTSEPKLVDEVCHGRWRVETLARPAYDAELSVLADGSLAATYNNRPNGAAEQFLTAAPNFRTDSAKLATHGRTTDWMDSVIR
jgi:hypothetical protein